MADAGDDVGRLSPSQQEALQQYIGVTDQEVKDAIPLLQRSQWNVQIAIAKFFDGEGPDPVAEAMAAQDIPRTVARHENLQEIPQQPVTHRSPWLLGLLLAPFGWGWKAAGALFRTFCYVLSFLPAPLRPRAITAGLRSTTGRRMLMPRDTAARFKREFDEEYGPNELPFFEGGLAQAHDLAKKELKFLLVFLMSPEHDDTASFVRGTLLSTDVVEFVKNPSNNIVLWGGNVLDSEAYQAATEYNCTKYPFTALVCLTPKEGSTRMGIVKRLVGPMPAATYLSELQGSMEKYGSDLEGERAREKREAAAAAAEAERRAQEKAEADARLEEKRELWKAWRVRQIMPEPPAGNKNVVRVALKMPEESGAGRIVRRFPQDAPLEELYAFVDCYSLLQQGVMRARTVLGRLVMSTNTMGDKIGKSGNLIVEQLALESDAEDDDDDEEDEEESG
ncbi:hypothetical protein ACCO45_009452 [Purpureocillium lilacinum]|uniref:Uncharacterized protein n=1 Tax=Purpureocillium lilacinum TaxID=33203 RepID=A0ACC4DME2_PURLI